MYPCEIKFFGFIVIIHIYVPSARAVCLWQAGKIVSVANKKLLNVKARGVDCDFKSLISCYPGEMKFEINLTK